MGKKKRIEEDLGIEASFELDTEVKIIKNKIKLTSEEIEKRFKAFQEKKK